MSFQNHSGIFHVHMYYMLIHQLWFKIINLTDPATVHYWHVIKLCKKFFLKEYVQKEPVWRVTALQ